MLGSALETILILMVNIYADEAEQTGKAPMKKGQPKPLLDWQFVELLRVAKAANWLRAYSMLENSDSVLILGKDTGPGLERLKRIEIKLQELGYYTYIIKEQPDKPGESVILLNLSIGATVDEVNLPAVSTGVKQNLNAAR